VLNPLKSVDQHIMDDADLAGPILFCVLFATFLLLVFLLMWNHADVLGRKKSFWIHLRIYFIGDIVLAFHSKSHVVDWGEFPSYGECAWILFAATCIDKCNWHHRLIGVFCSLCSKRWFAVDSLDIVLLQVAFGVYGNYWLVVAISWCTYSASAIFVAVLQLTEMRALVAYPVGLFCMNFFNQC